MLQKQATHWDSGNYIGIHLVFVLKIALTRSKPASNFEKNKSARYLNFRIRAHEEQDNQNGKHFHEVFDKLFDMYKQTDTPLLSL